MYSSVTETAGVEGIGSSYVSRVLRLTLLAPDIIENIFEGRIPVRAGLARLVKPFPVEWERQRELFC